jgi:mono/diheme cytochrome c family protein
MTLLRVLFFSTAVLLVYTVFANILPQVQSNPPEEDEPIIAGEMDQAGQIAWGEKLFGGKGTCTLCHNNLGRAPDLLVMNLNAAFSERLADEKYDGEAKGQEGAAAIETYLRESLIDPSAYVVAGFGKKGTNDTVSPMPVVTGPPISLSEAQSNAVIAFLQDKGGFDITVPLPEEDGEASAEDEDEEEEGPTESVEAAIEKFSCSACHDLSGSGADVGPKLGGIGKRMKAAEIRKSILDPNAFVAEGFEADTMPGDYNEQMRISELEMIVEYLSTLAEAEVAQ